MSVLRLLRRSVLCAAVAAVPVQLSAQEAGRFAFPINLQLGIPQGEFAQNVNLAGGFGFGGIWALSEWFAFRGGLDFQWYGYDRRRVPLGGGALGLINVDVTTTNAIVGGSIGAQVGVPGNGVRPYAGGAIGFSNFSTTSQVAGTNSDDAPFASSTNASDNAFAKQVFAGLYIPVGKGSTSFDIGARYTWNGESVRYLTPGDITEDANGNIVLSPNNTRADLLTIVIGLTIRPGRQR